MDYGLGHSPHPSDSSLLGDLARAMTVPDAVEVLALRYRGHLVRQARDIVGDSHRAEDVAQETLLRAAQSLEVYGREPAQVLAWAKRTARNIALDILRRDKHRGLPVGGDIPGMDRVAPDDRDERERAEWIEASRERAVRAAALAWGRMPPMQRRALIAAWRGEGTADRNRARTLAAALRRVRRGLHSMTRPRDQDVERVKEAIRCGAA